MGSTFLAVSAVVTAGLYALYRRWRHQLLRSASRECRRVGPLWLGQLAAKLMKSLAGLNGVRTASESGEGLKSDPTKQYMYVWHPHGFISYVPAHLLAESAVDGKPHGRQWFGTCLPLLFNIPMLGEVFELTNARPVDSLTLMKILGGGRSIAIQPGGVEEQAASRHDQEQAFFPAKLGFIRMAIQFGTPLMPLYLFGENQLYRRVDGFEWLTKLIRKVSGMTLPICTAKFGLPQAGLMPIATDIHIRWGKPVEVGPKDENPSDERVEEVYDKYVAELKKLFDENAKDCLPHAIAAKGLKVVRIEDKSESAESSKRK